MIDPDDFQDDDENKCYWLGAGLIIIVCLMIGGIGYLIFK